MTHESTQPEALPASQDLQFAMRIRDLCIDADVDDRDGIFHLDAAAKLLAAHDAEVRLAEAEWWADPTRKNGPSVLYPEEQQRIAALRADTKGGAR